MLKLDRIPFCRPRCYTTPAYFSRCAIPNLPSDPARSGRQSGSLSNDVGSFLSNSTMTSATILPPSSPRYSPLCCASDSPRTYNHNGVPEKLAPASFNSVAIDGSRPAARAMAPRMAARPNGRDTGPWTPANEIPVSAFPRLRPPAASSVLGRVAE